MTIASDSEAHLFPRGVMAVMRTGDGVRDLVEDNATNLLLRVHFREHLRNADHFRVKGSFPGSPHGPIELKRPIGEAVVVHEVSGERFNVCKVHVHIVWRTSDNSCVRYRYAMTLEPLLTDDPDASGASVDTSDSSAPSAATPSSAHTPSAATPSSAHTPSNGAYVPAGSAGSTHLAWESELHSEARVSAPHVVDVLVIGAGQAGLCAAYELQRRGFVGYSGSTGSARGQYVVLDAEVRPGGAWQHRWRSLTMGTVNHIADLPGMPVPDPDPETPAADFVPDYFTEFEEENDFAILRPIFVNSVSNDAGGKLRVETSAGTWLTDYIVNCTGTWTRPFIPYYPGINSFRGRQVHTQNFGDADDFWRERVLVVGGGISALDHLDDLSHVTSTIRWVTRTEPRFSDAIEEGEGLSHDDGRRIEREVRERVEAGYTPLPVVNVTGLPRTRLVRSLERRGLLNRQPMFDRIDQNGAWWGDHYEEFDAIVWATGFRFELRHLAPLKLRSKRGGVQMESTHAKLDPRIHFIGYGPSASTVGARTYARIAVRDIVASMTDASATSHP